MDGNLSNIVIILLFLGIGGLAIVSILVKLGKNRFAPIKTVKAIVVDKNKIESFSKYAGNGKHEKYVIIFSIDGRRKSFYVSKFSYGGYRVNEKGTLKYKGDKIIEFK